MKTAAFAVLLLLLGDVPASAQFGKLGDIASKAGKLSDLKISEQDERELGEPVSATVRTELGVLQDAAVTKYVSLLVNLLGMGVLLNISQHASPET